MLEKSLLEKSQGSIKPWEIGRFTIAEALMFLEDPRGRGPGGTPNMNDDEIAAELQRWQGLTPLERLRDVRR